MPASTLDVRPAGSRFHTRTSWLDSRHSFSFGSHYDDRNVGHGLLIVSNDDIVAPSGGFPTHGHRDMEIVTWVLDGELEHRDSTGTAGVIYPGLAQRMSAGRGIQHSEMNHSATQPVHFVQMWVVPDTAGIEPGYEQLDVLDRLDRGGLQPVVSGKDIEGTIRIRQRGATMWVGRLRAGEVVNVPAAPFVHVFVAQGDVGLATAALSAGDAVRLTDAGALELTATSDAEVLIWEMDGSIGS
jgi:redox-sensitive bicupin YhaK (pirin superfamily)